MLGILSTNWPQVSDAETGFSALIGLTGSTRVLGSVRPYLVRLVTAICFAVSDLTVRSTLPAR